MRPSEQPYRKMALFSAILATESDAPDRFKRVAGSPSGGRVGDSCTFNTDCLTIKGMYCSVGRCTCQTDFVIVGDYCYGSAWDVFWLIEGLEITGANLSLILAKVSKTVDRIELERVPQSRIRLLHYRLSQAIHTWINLLQRSICTKLAVSLRNSVRRYGLLQRATPVQPFASAQPIWREETRKTDRSASLMVNGDCHFKEWAKMCESQHYPW